MLALSLLLLMVWFGAQMLDLSTGAGVHLLALSALFLMLAHRCPRQRRV